MKNFLITFGLVSVFFPFTAFAITPSPAVVNPTDTIKIFCSNLHNWVATYKPDGTYVQFGSARCDTVNSGFIPANSTDATGRIDMVELNPDWVEEAPVGNEGDPLTFPAITATEWYVGQNHFIIADPAKEGGWNVAFFLINFTVITALFIAGVHQLKIIDSFRG